MRGSAQLATQKPVANVRRPQGIMAGSSGLTMSCHATPGSRVLQARSAAVLSAVTPSSHQIPLLTRAGEVTAQRMKATALPASSRHRAPNNRTSGDQNGDDTDGFYFASLKFTGAVVPHQ